MYKISGRPLDCMSRGHRFKYPMCTLLWIEASSEPTHDGYYYYYDDDNSGRFYPGHSLLGQRGGHEERGVCGVSPLEFREDYTILYYI